MENEPIETDSLRILETGALNTGARYDIVVLTPEHIDQIKSLLDATVAGLGPDEQQYMIPKSREYLEHHMHKGDGNGAIGVVSEGKLIAQFLVYHPTAADIDGVLGYVPEGVAAEDMTVLGGACVSKEYRGHGLMNRLVWNWLDYSSGWGRTHAAADIDVHNTPSWAAFIRAGLSLEHFMTDPRDGGLIYTAHEEVAKAKALRLTPEFNRHAGLPAVEVNGHDYANQKALMDSGYNAVAWDRQRQVMLLRHTRPPQP